VPGLHWSCLVAALAPCSWIKTAFSTSKRLSKVQSALAVTHPNEEMGRTCGEWDGWIDGWFSLSDNLRLWGLPSFPTSTSERHSRVQALSIVKHSNEERELRSEWIDCYLSQLGSWLFNLGSWFNITTRRVMSPSFSDYIWLMLDCKVNPALHRSRCNKWYKTNSQRQRRKPRCLIHLHLFFQRKALFDLLTIYFVLFVLTKSSRIDLRYCWFPDIRSLNMHISALTCFVLLTSFLSFTTSALPALPTQEQSQKDNTGSFKINVFRKESRNITWVHSGGVQWSTQVSIGSQKYTLLIDTGSSDL